MGLFRQKPSPATTPPPAAIFPSPVPAPGADGLRDFTDQRDYILGLLSPLAPFGVALLDAVGLTLSESITADQDHPVSGLRAGDVMARQGVNVQPRLVGLLAAVGIGKVIVRPRPRVVVIPVTRPPVDGLYPASLLVAAELQSQGAQVFHLGAPADAPGLAEVINDQLIRADLIVTTGGFETGETDIASVLDQLGLADTTPVAITPGRRQGFALVGDERTPLLALPGEATAAHVLWATLVAPAVRRLAGAADVLPPLERARATRPVAVTPGLLTAAHVQVADGALEFRPRRTGVDAMVAINRADGLALLASETGQINIGAWVDYIPLTPPTAGR
ncbi:MAG: hypothetical protein LBK42_11330 [Propionibacteriaceae bacterium]|jgi:molybdopterin molybdotransferase|nr:hypothetical protein [Propionibacteriaceae bacterium]